MQPRLGAALVLAVLGACAPREQELRPARRVVLVTLDTLRMDALFAGAESMPRTALWAERATVFERYYSSSPVTQPAHASFLTGLQPWEHGVTRNGLVLDTSFETVPEVLSRAGWRTGAVVASFPLTSAMGFDQGFDVYRDEFDRRMDERWNDMEMEEFYSLGSSVTQQALALLDQLGGESQFLWVHYFDAHAPYGDAGDLAATGNKPVRYPRKLVFEGATPEKRAGGLDRVKRLYAWDVSVLDRDLDRLFRRLATDAEAGVETHVLLVSDHGESFGEDGSLGHGRRLTAPQLHVPLVIRSPRLAPGRVDEGVGSVDVARTLLALAGGELASSVGGRDLLQRDAAREDPVVGMRTTFATEGVVSDPRIDGSTVELEGPRWFAAVDGVLYSGNATAVWVQDDERRPAPEAVAARLRPLFARFAAESVEAAELGEEGTRAALDALGYAEE